MRNMRNITITIILVSQFGLLVSGLSTGLCFLETPLGSLKAHNFHILMSLSLTVVALDIGTVLLLA